MSFLQPTASSIALIRVDPKNGVSRLRGKLTANGQVWLVNPSGVWFGPEAQVSVAGFVAEAADSALTVSGQIDVSARRSSESGGSVRLLAKTIHLTRTALIDVSGDAGGGKAFIGGTAARAVTADSGV